MEKKNAILLSTYNGEKFILNFLESIFYQKFKNYTLFIRDDGSSDRTLSIIMSNIYQLDIVFLNDGLHLGPAKSFMKLLESVPDCYAYFFFADQDDYWLPLKIEQAVKELSSYDDRPALYCSRLELVDADLSHLSYTKIPKILSFSNSLVENIATGCTIAINFRSRDILLKHIPNRIIMHDWWMYVVISAFGVVLYDNNSYIKYRQHSANVIGMDSNFFRDYFNRAVRFFKSDNIGFSAISMQTIEFFHCFSRCMSEEQAKLVLQLIEGKASFLKRCYLIFFSKFRRQNFFSNCVLKFRFLINRY